MFVDVPAHESARRLAAAVESARELHWQGRYLDAQALLPWLEASPQVDDRLLAARIVGHLGARRAGEARALRLWRAHRDDAGAFVEAMRYIVYRRGPFRGWQVLQAGRLPPAAPAPALADWHSLRCFVLGALHDFDNAQQAHALARELAPDDPWILIEWAQVCERRDDYAQAVEFAEQALRMRPGYRAAVQALAHLYTLVGRDDDAMSLLLDATRAAQSGSLAMQLFELQLERGERVAAERTLEIALHCSPRAEKPLREWFDARRTDIALALGRRREAADHARRAGGEFHERLADRLDDPAVQPRRVELPVGFVRQHAVTCAPATLATLSGYWGHQAAHLDIAEKICYDGTPNHSERRWAEEQGFVVREFTVDWQVAAALLDAGVPFTLTTIGTEAGHLQAVIGYDALRGSLLIRDPFKRTYNEFEARSLFESHRSNGPRGMLLLPAGQAHRLAGIELPEAPAWDDYHRVMSALAAHRRDDAQVALASMEAAFGDHRLTWQARRAVACYDNDPQGELAATERLLERYPADTNLRLAKARLLPRVADRDQQAAWWQTFPQDVGADPVALTRYADFLLDDGRALGAARRLYERALRMAPTHAQAWAGLANAAWHAGERQRAAELSRIAASLQETSEGLAETHFRTCRFMGQANDGLAFLRRRVERLAHKASGPVMTLFGQLDAMERTTEAFEVLQHGLALRPNDGGLLVFAAEAHLRYGDHAAAQALLEQAEPHAYRPVWLRLKARWLRDTGQPDAAIECARQAGALDPQDVGLHQLAAALRLQRHGQAVALAGLREACEAQPHHLELQQLFVGWLGPAERDEALAVLARLVQAHPTHAWAHRELAFRLCQAGRHEEAWQAASAALTLAPWQTFNHSTLGHVRLGQGRIDDARRHFRDAIALSVDNEFAIESLVGLETTLQSRRESLAHVRGELERQVTLGDGLLVYQACAQTAFDDPALLAELEVMLAAREDLWQAWAAVALQRVRCGQHAQAIELLAAAVARFPLVPRLHVEQARATMLSGGREAARELLLQALRIAPGWHRPVHLFVETVMDEGVALERALPVLDAALHRDPNDAHLRALRARIRHRIGERDLARQELEAALQLDPALRWAWDVLEEILHDSGERGASLAFAQRVAQQHPGNVAAWLRVADRAPDTDSALAAIDRALSLEPRNETAFEARLATLQQARRHDEVMAALAAAPWPEGLPVALAAFEARVAHAQDRHRDAVDLLRRLLERDPSHYGLWQELADWHDQQGRDRPYLEAAGHLVRLAPNHAVAHAYLGHAHDKCKEPEAACRHYARAIELDPAHLFSGVRLADLQIAAGELEAAARTVTSLRTHHRHAALPLRELHIAVKRDDEAAVRASLAEIAAARDDPPAVCEEALALLQAPRWQPVVLATIEQAFTRGPCAAPACRHWLANQDPGWLPGAYTRHVVRTLGRDPSRSLLSEVLAQQAKEPQGHLLRSVLRRWRDTILGDDEAWGMLGYAYLSHGRFRAAARWMADWPSRPGAPAWALDNQALALRALGRDRQAREASEAALRVHSRNQDALTWLAVDAAMAADLAALRRLLLRVDEATPRDFFQLVVRALRAYLEAAEVDDSRLALNEYARLRATCGRGTVPGRLVRRLAARLVRRHTHWAARPWRWVQFALALDGPRR